MVFFSVGSFFVWAVGRMWKYEDYALKTGIWTLKPDPPANETPQTSEMDRVYADRNLVVQLCCTLAKKCGMDAGIRRPQEDPEWPVLVIDLPEGEVAWHLPEEEVALDFTSDKAYDGHSDDEKARRIRDFVRHAG